MFYASIELIKGVGTHAAPFDDPSSAIFNQFSAFVASGTKMRMENKIN